MTGELAVHLARKATHECHRDEYRALSTRYDGDDRTGDFLHRLDGGFGRGDNSFSLVMMRLIVPRATTIASSTTMPMASTNPNRMSRLIEKEAKVL